MANKDLVTVVLDTAKSLGYGSLKPEQETALVSFLRGHDVFVSLPTGYGKFVLRRFAVCLRHFEEREYEHRHCSVSN